MSRVPVRLNAPSEALDDDPRLAGLLTDRLVAITPDTAPLVAAEVMSTSHVRHLPVLDGDRCLGVLVEPDLVRALAMPAFDRDRLAPVARLCRRVEVLGPEDRRSAAAVAMYRTGVDAVLVVEHERLIGIVTATDLVRSLVPWPGGIGTSDRGGRTTAPGMVNP